MRPIPFPYLRTIVPQREFFVMTPIKVGRVPTIPSEWLDLLLFFNHASCGIKQLGLRAVIRLYCSSFNGLNGHILELGSTLCARRKLPLAAHSLRFRTREM